MILVSPFLTVRVEQVRGGGQVSGQVSGLVWIRNSTQSFYLSRAEREGGGRGSVVAISSLALPRFVVCFVQNHFNWM